MPKPPTTHEPADALVHVHPHISVAARRDLRIAAAQTGVTMSGLVTRWAASAPRASKLVIPARRQPGFSFGPDMLTRRARADGLRGQWPLTEYAPAEPLSVLCLPRLRAELDSLAPDVPPHIVEVFTVRVAWAIAAASQAGVGDRFIIGDLWWDGLHLSLRDRTWVARPMSRTRREVRVLISVRHLPVADRHALRPGAYNGKNRYWLIDERVRGAGHQPAIPITWCGGSLR